MAGKRVKFVDIADDTSLTVVAEADNPTSARLDQLAHNPENRRYGYDEPEDEELVDSLRELGQVQAVTAVARDVFIAHFPQHTELLADARWVVVDGNRRLAAARRAGLPSLRLTVQDNLGAIDDPRISEAALVANIHRAQLPPLLEARELASLVERHGSQSAVARRLSKSQGWISQRLALLRLTDELQQALRNGAITVEDARAVASQPATKQVAALDLLRRNRSKGSAATAAAVPKPRHKDGAAADQPSRVPRSIRLGPVDAVAAELRHHFSVEELRQLSRLLLD